MRPHPQTSRGGPRGDAPHPRVERQGSGRPPGVFGAPSQAMPQPYAKIYADVRRAVDLCHCDGEIKDPVAIDPGRYIKRSPQLARMLAQLRLGGTQARACGRAAGGRERARARGR
eukprot:4828365-Prymnesium_polylepis.1